MICALSASSSGDLRALYALELGLRIDQVRLWELKPGAVYEFGTLIRGLLDDMPVLVTTYPEHWADDKGVPS